MNTFSEDVVNNEALFLVPASTFTGTIGVQNIFSEQYSNSASTRLHLHPALRSSMSLGLSPKILGLNSDQPDYLSKLSKPRICILDKLFIAPSSQHSVTMANLACIARLKRLRVPILSTYSDNWCVKDKLISELYKDILDLSDCVVFPSKSIYQQGMKYLNSKAAHEIIEDPCFLKRQEYHSLDINERLRLLWFGHSTNSSYLLKVLPSIFENCNQDRDYELTIFSDVNTNNYLKEEILKIKYHESWQLRFVTWKWSSHGDELARAHICLLPSNVNSHMKAYAGHNRVVDSVQSGCLVVATPLSSYQELSQVLLLGDDFATLINHGINQYERLIAKWDPCREKLLSRFSPKNNQDKWENCIKRLLKS